jgi:hypothetical protein
MTAKRILIGVLVLGVMLWGSLPLGFGEKEEKTEKASQVIVGTFDSRAVMMAYSHAVRAGRMPSIEAAETSDPNATPQQIKQRSIDRRRREFRQGFGMGDVSEYLDLIRDQIPKIAQKTGVDIIVSKWDIEYYDPKVKFLDVTEVLIQPFEPSKERLKIIQDVRKAPPASDKEIRKFFESGKEI